jgi:pimeloyl-ACP methyl ester carboxylesterase/DNA-binding CsgD family transcriptional regulator
VRQQIRFVTTADRTRIAWARHGHGPALIRVATWLTHLEYDWESPVWRHWLSDLGTRFTIVRYDDRGSGLSDRTPAQISFQAWISDLEAVVNEAGFERFTLLGMSQAGSVAIAYAARHPERVRNLVLYGAYARGALAREPSPEAREEVDALQSLTRIGWGRANPVFRRLFTTSFIPGASEAQMRWFDDLQQRSADGDTACKMSQVRAEIDVTQLAQSLTCPTLVMHVDGDEAVPFDEGRRLASLIPDARFVPLQGKNHILLADEPAWPRFLEELSAFMGSRWEPEPPAGPVHPLSDRELHILRYVAEGRSNEEIADTLVLSVRTIERHLTNAYSKLGLSGKSARAAAAARLARLEP